MRIRYMILLSSAMFLLTGCINISTRFQPDDLSVKEELQGSDCVPIIFSIGIGTADIEKAKLDGKKAEWSTPEKPFTRYLITKVRRVEINDLAFLFFGAKCVDVVGEP